MSGNIPEPAHSWLTDPGTPVFAVPPTLSEWEAQRRKIRDTLLELLGQLPPRPPAPQIEMIAREDRGDFVIERFRMDNGAGAMVPGIVLLPRGLRKPAPAILYCHWHGGDYPIGKEELFQSAHTPEPPGPALAQHGFVVLAIDAPCFGERANRGPGGAVEPGRQAEESTAKFNLWTGRTFWGMLLRDDLTALDYLASRPEVDPTRIGVTGISMGSTRTWWLMALDERLKAGVGVACLTRYQNLIAHDSLAEHSLGYYVPRMLTHFDTEAVVALIAPRAILFQTGDRDAGSPIDGVREVESLVRPLYRMYGRDEAFGNLIYPNVGHRYTAEMWTRTQAWLADHLGTASS
ncbi:MAG TPA: alpha/beta hydrolase family protein [Candidatus Didemnitutus sp.]|nr:alpha/beta hydrolase family protein [Candidatus Didemnitutus sp.]